MNSPAIRIVLFTLSGRSEKLKQRLIGMTGVELRRVHAICARTPALPANAADLVLWQDCGQSCWADGTSLHRISPPVLLVIESPQPKLLGRAVRAGFSGVLTISLDVCQLRLALPAARAGGFYISWRVRDYVMKPSAGALPDAPLTRREAEILHLQISGMEYKQIAAQLHLSEHTVSNHLYSARQKLGVANALLAAERLRNLPVVPDGSRHATRKGDSARS